jgi:hypothetical protein
MTQQTLVGQSVLTVVASQPHSDTPHSVGLLWTSNETGAETSTWKHTALKGDSLQSHQRESDLQSQQMICRRATP